MKDWLLEDESKFTSPKDGEMTYTYQKSLDFMFKGEVITLNVGDILNFETGEIERANNGTNKDN